MESYRRSFIKKITSLLFFIILPIKLLPKPLTDSCDLTNNDIEGPFYIEDSPNISILTPPEITSDFLFITGTVYAKDCITPIPNAIVDVWHANRGEYDKATDSFLGSNYNDNYGDPPYYRAKIYTDINGNYAYQTIVPGKYLNGTYYRPSHIHYKSSYLGQNEITTQLYFEGDSSITDDFWASSPDALNRIINLEIDDNNNKHGVFDIVLDVEPEIVNNTNLNEHNIIRSIFPNPINSKSIIYLECNNNLVDIEICDINGRNIVKKYNVYGNKINLYKLLNYSINQKKGIYILKVIINNQAVQSKRFSIL